jgi:hypothetical protein
MFVIINTEKSYVQVRFKHNKWEVTEDCECWTKSKYINLIQHVYD